MSALELRGIGHSFPGASSATVSEIDLSIADGEMVSVVGPSGSGKSTLLRVAAGLTTPTVGEVLLDGQVVTGRPTESRDLTVMFQQPHLFTHLDVLGNVAFGLRLTGLSRRAARRQAGDYLELVHLGGFGRRRPRQLSGGQQQRVALARALATQRGVLLLDEPFSSLDHELRTSMHDLLAEVRTAVSPTIVLVTHDLDEAALADRIAVLIDGRLHQVGPPADLYRSPATLATARLVGGFNELIGRVEHGWHYSALGSVELLPDTLGGATSASGTASEAVLLLRREDLVISCPAGHPAGDASAWTIGRGPANSEPPGISGTVRKSRRSGPRQTVTVQIEGCRSEGPMLIEVELPPGGSLEVGESAVVRLRTGARGRIVDPQ